MRSLIACAPVLAVILACKPDPGGSTSEGDTSTGGTTAASTSTTAGTTSTTTGTSTTAEPTSTTSTTTGGPDSTTTAVNTTTDPGVTTVEPETTTTTTTGKTTTDTTDTSTTGDPGNVEYAALFWAGGLDRIVVRKADHDNDLCTSVVFVWPGPDVPDPDLTLPGMWGWQNGEIAQGAADCFQFMGPLMNAVNEQGHKGSADWVPENGCPATLDIDLALVFPQVMPWVPAQDILQANAIPVQGC